MRLYGAISKVTPQSDGTVRVEGIASTEATDDQGEVVRREAMRAAIPEYMRFPALREMHQLSAAGTTLEAEVGDDGITRIVAHVVDPVAVTKVKNQVYRGFSIGGRVTQRDPGNPKTILGLVLSEISLVDRPANPEAVLNCWKAAAITTEGKDDMEGLATIGDTAAGQALAALVQPVQIWACEVADHRHLVKADAVKCLEQATAAPVAEKAEHLAEAVEADAAVDTPSEHSGSVAEPEAQPDLQVDAEASTDKGAVGPAEGATEAEPSAEADDAAEVEKRAQEGAAAAQELIDAAMKALERGEIALAAPVEKVIDPEPDTADEGTLFGAADPKVAHSGFEPIPIDTEKCIYGVSPQREITGISDISEVRVGGIPWRKVSGTPAQGEWRVVDLDRGYFQLGSIPLTNHIRCDVLNKNEDAARQLVTARDWSQDSPGTTISGGVAKADDSKKPYGDVEYADPGYQDDGKQRYPIDTERHIRAAWTYINQPADADKYSADQVKRIKAKIIAAWKEKIDKDGPPSAEKATEAGDIAKSIYDVGSVAQLIVYLDELAESLAWEAMLEGDESTLSQDVRAMCGQACALLRNLASEETAEIMAGTEVDEGDLVEMAARVETLRKAGLTDAADKLSDAVEKAGAKHSARDQMLLDTAHQCAAKCMKTAGCTKAMTDNLGEACKAMEMAGGKPWADDGAAEKAQTTFALDALAKGGAHQALMDMAHDCLGKMTRGASCESDTAKAGARHSKETMDHLRKAHGYLCAAGATCDMTKDDSMAMAGTSEDLAKALDTERAEKAAMAKVLGDLVPMVDRLTEHLKTKLDVMAADIVAIKETPMPPATIAGPSGAMVKGGVADQPELTDEQVAAAFAKLPKERQTKALIGVALANPVAIDPYSRSADIRDGWPGHR